MPSRPSRADHEAAVARRLEQLTAELAGVRGGPAGESRSTPAAEPVSAVPPPPPDPPLVPTPGRHAARRRGSTADGLVPEPLRGRVALGPAQVAVVAVLVAAGLAVTAWWVVRSDPAPVAPVAPTAPASGSVLATPSDDATPTAGGDGAPVTVDVAGKVRRPGIAVLDAGARVVDALEAAGGARPGVDLSGLNLARLLVDGEQILVGVAAPAAAPPVSASPGDPAATGGPLVNINTAGLAELETLPEVGPVTAQAIITWRDENGGYTAVDELLEVDGIGEATLEAMAPFVTV
ncbi:helix-hairpin-helix domain-containing protein [Nocardioides sp. GXQ0305]|uniref:helix-hairpin-helix domain-containing protein n=1 Tax=Nocardioides sp. GXQ0305 TaxID=3423912 RepID=UPI003D7C8E81